MPEQVVPELGLVLFERERVDLEPELRKLELTLLALD